MLTAADVMTTDVITVTPDTPLREIAKLLSTRRISGVPVIDPNRAVVGLVSEGDLMKHVEVIGEQRRSWWLTLFAAETMLAHDYAKTHGRRAQDVMSSDVITVTPTASLAEIATTLERHRIKRVSRARLSLISIRQGDVIKERAAWRSCHARLLSRTAAALFGHAGIFVTSGLASLEKRELGSVS
jgi:CBS domain-containing protein